MKLFKRMKDGGTESSVTGYWLVEIKSLFSVVLLRFDGASREAFHTHAFNCLSWVIRGELSETFLNGKGRPHKASWKPFITRRDDFHKVASVPRTSWVLSLRGPWAKTWKEYLPNEGRFVTLANGRVEV